MFPMSNVLAQNFQNQPNMTPWIVAGLIVLVGLFVIGLRDLLRLSPRRIWALSGVVFDESIRKRVLLLAPLAMLGVIIVSQLQRPTDELEAIRAIIKFCLFATGLVVVITSIILTCTNLPREIENRVIFTIVTKPTTRLEIVAGKVIGFGRVSAAILLIMGAFTWGYLSFREWQVRGSVAERLDVGQVSLSEKSTLEHYRQYGLLEAKTFEQPLMIDILGRTPDLAGTEKWITGSGEQEFLIPFDVNIDDLFDNNDAKTGIGGLGLEIVADVEYARTRSAGVDGIAPATGEETLAVIPATQPGPEIGPYMGPIPFITEQRPEVEASKQPPTMVVQMLGREMYNMITPNAFNGGRPVVLPIDQRAAQLSAYVPPDQTGPIYNEVSPFKKSRLWVGLNGGSPAWDFKLKPDSVKLRIVNPQNGQTLREISAGRRPDGSPVDPWVRGRSGRMGQQVRGTLKPGENPLGYVQYRGVSIPQNMTGDVAFEMVVGIERSGADLDENDDTPTTVDLEFRNLSNPTAASHNVTVHPESRRTTYFTVPASAVAGGNFDVLTRVKTEGHWIELTPASLSIVSGTHPFVWNLIKSLFVLWLMSMLVVVIALLCSTFLSWPIAVVLTIVALLGHWGVSQLGDSAQSGIGNAWAQQLFPNDAPKAKAISSTVEGLNTFLNSVASILPDISQYRAAEAIQRGMTVPFSAILDALIVTLGYGLPAGVLAYVFFKNKEVAP